MKAAAAALLLIVFPATGLMFRQNLTPSTLQGALAEVDGPQTYYEDDERGGRPFEAWSGVVGARPA